MTRMDHSGLLFPVKHPQPCARREGAPCVSAPSLSLTIRSCAAVEAAITAGSFDSRSGDPDRADEAGERGLRHAGRPHLAQEPRPLGRRTDQPDEAEAPGAERRGDDLEIERVGMGHDDNQRAVGRAGDLRGRLRREDQRHVGGRMRPETRRAANRSSAPRTAAARARARARVRRGPRRTGRLRVRSSRSARSIPRRPADASIGAPRPDLLSTPVRSGRPAPGAP